MTETLAPFVKTNTRFNGVVWEKVPHMQEMPSFDQVRIFGPVVAMPNASQRTKNRCREHSLAPTLVVDGAAVRKNIDRLGECILFGCQECEWEGWLPTAEIGEA